jgi:hypothetical protein
MEYTSTLKALMRLAFSTRHIPERPLSIAHFTRPSQSHYTLLYRKLLYVKLFYQFRLFLSRNTYSQFGNDFDTRDWPYLDLMVNHRLT